METAAKAADPVLAVEGRCTEEVYRHLRYPPAHKDKLRALNAILCVFHVLLAQDKGQAVLQRQKKETGDNACACNGQETAAIGGASHRLRRQPRRLVTKTNKRRHKADGTGPYGASQSEE